MFLSPAYIVLGVGMTGHSLYREFFLGLLKFLRETMRMKGAMRMWEW